MLSDGLVTTLGSRLPIGDGVTEVSICVHSDTPVSVIIRLSLGSNLSVS